MNQYEQAEVVYRRAVEIAGDDGRRARSLAEVGRVQARQGKGDDAWARRLEAIDAFIQAGDQPPARLYADMLEIATLNWGYFHDLPDDGDVLRVLDDGLRTARSTGGDVSLARLLMERGSFTGDPSGTEHVFSMLDSNNPARFADAAHRRLSGSAGNEALSGQVLATIRSNGLDELRIAQRRRPEPRLFEASGGAGAAECFGDLG